MDLYTTVPRTLSGIETHLRVFDCLLFRPFLTRKFFQEILGLEGSKISWGKKRPRPKFPQEILARILLAEEILKPKISWRQQEILRGNFGIT